MNQSQTVQYDMEGLPNQSYDRLGLADPPETQHTPAEAFETPAAPQKPADIFSLDAWGSWREAFHRNSW